MISMKGVFHFFKILSRLNARSSTKVNNFAIAILLLLIKFLKPSRYNEFQSRRILIVNILTPGVHLKVIHT